MTDIVVAQESQPIVSASERAKKANDIYNLANAAWIGVKFPVAGAVFAFMAMLLNQMGGNSSNKPCDYSAPETYLISTTAALTATVAFAALATLFAGVVANPIRKKADLTKLNAEEKQKFIALVQPDNKQLAAIFCKILFAGTLSFSLFGIAEGAEKCGLAATPELQKTGVKFGIDTAIAGGTTMLFLVLNMLTKLKIPKSQYVQVFVALLTSFEFESLAEILTGWMGITDPALKAATTGTLKFTFAGLAGAAAGLVLNAPSIQQCWENATLSLESTSIVRFFRNAAEADGYRRIAKDNRAESFQPDLTVARAGDTAEADSQEHSAEHQDYLF
jgi:hypothetical protein